MQQSLPRTRPPLPSSVAAFASEFITDISSEHVIEVATVHPRALPKADVIKLDVEGAERAILSHLDLTEVSLIMLEYHDLERRMDIERMTAGNFAVERRTAFPWAPYLRGDRYRPRSRGDEYGVLILVNRRLKRMHRADRAGVEAAYGPRGLRQALAPVPGLAAAAVRRRATTLGMRLGRIVR
jgi:hypothetical protein